MKRIFLFIFAIVLSLNALAQLEVKPGSFKEVHGFVNINDDPNYQTDDNDLPYAVIKVRTENITDKQRRELRFEGNGGTFIVLEYHTGEVWVYLTAKYADYLKISHPDFGVYEYTLPCDLQPKKGYEMALVYKAYAPVAPVKDIYNFLIITADQPNATIYVDDVYVGESGEQGVYKSFRAGEKHNWRIECELYHSESGEATIPVKEGENITVEKRLRPAFGYLNITSSPENGAVVFIDSKKVGQTPFKSDRLASGEHRVRVMKEMFSTAEKTFTVTDGNTTQAPMTMAANFVSVNITTDSNSDIYVDNEKKGTGTWNGRLSDGPHSLEARKASHKTAIKNVQLTLGTTENIVIPDPEPIYGTLEVVSNPIGANIIIDGKNYGTTPRVLGNVLIGTHELRLEKTGCTPVIKNFTLDDKNKLSINEKLPTGKETSKTITVAQTGGESSVKLTFATGAGNGVFSVSSNKKVQFSQGNLQYQASTRTWRFAEHQWDIIGDANKNISSSYSGWIDLFGWGTSGYNGKNPWMTSTTSTDYGNGNWDIAGTNYDWGVNNTISNGGGKSWRTLTRGEWVYVFNIRSTSSGIRYAKATVNGVNGVILLPDNWNSSNYSLSSTNNDRASYSSNRISQSDWTNRLEANGAVFLPAAAGWRSGTYVYGVGSNGFYWSASYGDSDGAYGMYFGESNLGADWDCRASGRSVRLVCSAEN
ncbi:MAG: PEGA domain-containing protein [Bacteroidales bacterium]|nr:PEGA domain-containing protein [Bacteroidales bacterium]